MFLLFEIGNAPTIESMAVSIPESLGLLIFGIGLVVVAVLLRSMLAKSEKPKSDEKVAKRLS
ncbi:MAG: hypothetical protein ABL999_04990 [Pyrinomonadaceae bacterium]